MPALFDDLRFAARSLARSKTLTAAAILTLALGIGINTALFSGVHFYLWSPFPYPGWREIVALAQTNPAQGLQKSAGSWQDVEDWRAARSLSAVAAYSFSAATLTGAGEPARVIAVAAGPELFSVLRVSPARGRAFLAGDRRAAILSHGLWQRQFGADPSLLGRQIRLDGANYTVAGILPAAFTFLYEDADLFVPLEVPPQNRAARSLAALARLRPGVTLAQARAEIAAISARRERESPATNLGWSAALATLDDELIPRRARVAAQTLLLASSFVLLIACANVASLLLARGALRRAEFAIRATLGAGRAALIRLLLAESLLLALAGAAAALLLAWWLIPVLKSLSPPDPRGDAFALNPTALRYALAFCLSSGVLAGIAPAWRLSRAGLFSNLREDARAGSRPGLLSALVVLEVAAAVVLLAGAGLMVRSLLFQVHASPGFDRTNLLITRVEPLEPRSLDDVLAALRRNAQVRGAAAATSLPPGNTLAPIVVEGRATVGPRDLVSRVSVTPAYFRTLGVPLLAGRDFTDAEAAPAAVVNESLACRYWSSPARALGARFRLAGPWIKVVGVARDVRHQGADQPAHPELFLPWTQAPAPSLLLIARTAVDPARVAPAMRAALRAAGPDLPLSRIESVEDLLARRTASIRAMAQLLGGVAALALALASLGIYGLMAYAAARRTREIGVRIALGARPRDIFRMVLAAGFRLALAGLAVGLPCALAVTPLMRALLGGVRPYDPLAFCAVTLLLLSLALLACILPARRATRLDPAAVLRA